MAELRPERLLVLDPAFGYEPGWRRAVLDLLAGQDRRDLGLSVNARPEQLQRLDADKLYKARAGVVLEVGTLSHTLLGRTGQAPYPRKAVDHALELLEYLGAKGVATHARFEFNQPGETEETAAETLDALERFAAAVPNTSVTVDAQPWAFQPISEPEADVDAPASRFGTRIEHPEWWKEHADSRTLATAVVASAELAGRPPATRATGGRGSRSCSRRSTPSSPPRRGAACAVTRRWDRPPTECRTGGGASPSGTDGERLSARRASPILCRPERSSVAQW